MRPLLMLMWMWMLMLQSFRAIAPGTAIPLHLLHCTLDLLLYLVAAAVN